jgi:hypothetical protein
VIRVHRLTTQWNDLGAEVRTNAEVMRTSAEGKGAKTAIVQG